ncbi:MAG: hypothetical protein CSA74_04815 [Rhodobacterales bacterium]|nr:MAG: hypothetical protein CSA74_04815 [Rhodobacterales bacterium]
MAVLNAYFAFNFDNLDWNFYIQNFNRDWLAEDWEDMSDDRYSVFSTNDDRAFVQQGTGFATDDMGQMTIGTTEYISEWVWEDDQPAELSYRFSDISVSAAAVNDALRSENPADERGLLAGLLSGDDEFNLSAGADLARGFAGADTMRGGKGADVLYGNQGADFLSGGGNRDTLYGGNGRDTVYGGKGNDKLYGGNGNDTLYGGTHNDKLYGNQGRDALRGQNGNDMLFGGKGHDRLHGGKGNDTLTGGRGHDTFVFKSGDDAETVKDFTLAGNHSDKVDLSGMASITGWNDLKGNHMTQNGADVVIDAGNGDVMTLENVTLADLAQDHFIF